MQTKDAYLEVLRLTNLSLLLWSTAIELLTILMIRGCTSIVHPLIIKIFNNSETVDRRKNLWKQKLLISLFYVLLTNLFYYDQQFLSWQKSWWSEDVHTQIIKIVNNSETVSRRKKLMKTKVAYLVALRRTYSSFSHFLRSGSFLAPNRCHSSESWHVSEHVTAPKAV